jgi:hypothetical protein
MKQELSFELIGERVRVYRNLANGLLSVQSKIKGSWKVAGHAESLLLYDVDFKVSEKGRQRVITHKRKNVHAFVYGNLGNISRWTTFFVNGIIMVSARFVSLSFDFGDRSKEYRRSPKSNNIA